MKFSTDDPSLEIIDVAKSWFDRGYRPVVIYPAQFPRKQRDRNGSPVTVPTSGKEPFGKGWGAKPITPKTLTDDIRHFDSSGLTPGLGLCIGPDRAPGGRGLMDVEGDGPEAEDSRAKLLGGEEVATIGHASVRGCHQFFSYDWNRLEPVLKKLNQYQKGAQPGVYHLPQLPGLELRIGGLNDQGEIKQLQTVIPPTPGTDGQPRVSNGVTTLAEVPESFYQFLEQSANIPISDEQVSNDTSRHDTTTGTEESTAEKKKRGRPKGSGVGNSIEEWLHKQLNKALEDVENASLGERHILLLHKIKWLAGYLHYGCGFNHEELERAGVDAANKSAPERAHDNPRCVRDAIAYGLTLPVQLPDRLHEKYTRFKKSLGPLIPKPSANGAPTGPREPGDDDPGTGPGAPSGHELTDRGNAFRFIQVHGSDISYIKKWNSWYVWMGDRWKEDDTDSVDYLCQDIPDKLKHEAALLGPDDGTETLKWALMSESAERLKAIEKIARSSPVVRTRPDQFDSNPWQLNCTNGTLDLQAVRLDPHVRSDLILKTTGTAYDPAAACPLWDQFLYKVFDGNMQLIDYIQKLVGYSVVGVTSEAILVFLSGEGANGKSTFFETISVVVGDYSCSCNPDLLVERKYSSGNLHDLADLFGRRFVFTAEVNEGASLAESLVKHITGGDTIRARRLWENAFEFKPSHTIWFSSNHMPNIKGRDHGIWRRIKRIPFDVTIPDAQQDKDFKRKLAGERSGILRWIVEGVAKWRRGGLGEPQIVTDAVEEYREETDLYGPFFADYCDTGEGLKCLHGELFKDFLYWLELNQITKISSNKFSRLLKSRGFHRDRTGDIRLALGLQPNGKLIRPGNQYTEYHQKNWQNE